MMFVVSLPQPRYFLKVCSDRKQSSCLSHEFHCVYEQPTSRLYKRCNLATDAPTSSVGVDFPFNNLVFFLVQSVSGQRYHVAIVPHPARGLPPFPPFFPVNVGY